MIFRKFLFFSFMLSLAIVITWSLIVMCNNVLCQTELSLAFFAHLIKLYNLTFFAQELKAQASTYDSPNIDKIHNFQFS